MPAGVFQHPDVYYGTFGSCGTVCIGRWFDRHGKDPVRISDVCFQENCLYYLYFCFAVYCRYPFYFYAGTISDAIGALFSIVSFICIANPGLKGTERFGWKKSREDEVLG